MDEHRTWITTEQPRGVPEWLIVLWAVVLGLALIALLAAALVAVAVA